MTCRLGMSHRTNFFTRSALHSATIQPDLKRDRSLIRRTGEQRAQAVERPKPAMASLEPAEDRPLQQLCQVCFKATPAYKCPNPTCNELKYCSVACFKLHKQRANCSGFSDNKGAVLQFVSRHDLGGPPKDAAFGGRPKEVDDETESRRRLVGNRDYNFLNLVERRIGVGKNISHEVLKKGDRKLKRKAAKQRKAAWKRDEGGESDGEGADADEGADETAAGDAAGDAAEQNTDYTGEPLAEPSAEPKPSVEPADAATLQSIRVDLQSVAAADAGIAEPELDDDSDGAPEETSSKAVKRDAEDDLEPEPKKPREELTADLEQTPASTAA
ncbi:uncharacterized protein V1510DRAFT_412593 [Dipodascopsis tothii]|uniref:uncharacterized protein n=1 Tax=Dipodascopsis tothii TaxID=44089 RepID=UPI0034CDF170